MTGRQLKMIRITSDCPGLENASPDSAVVCEIAAGSFLQLLRDDDRDYYKVAFQREPVFVPKSSAEPVESGETREILAVPPKPKPPEPRSEPPTSQPLESTEVLEASPEAISEAAGIGQVRILSDCDAVRSTFNRKVLFRVAAGSGVQLLGEERCYYKVASQGLKRSCILIARLGGRRLHP